MDRFFDVWLFRPERPARTAANGFEHKGRKLTPAERQRVDDAVDRVRAQAREIARAEGRHSH